MSTSVPRRWAFRGILLAVICAQLLLVPPAAAWDEVTYAADIRPHLASSFRVHYNCPSSSIISNDISSYGYGTISNDSCSVFFSYFVYNLSLPTNAYVESLNVTVPFRDNPGTNTTLVSWAVRHVDGPITGLNLSESRAWLDRANRTPNSETFSNRENETRAFTAGSALLSSFRAAVAAGNSTFYLLLAPVSVTASAILNPLANVTLHIAYDASPPDPPQNVNAAAVEGAGVANITWNAALDEGIGVDGYEAAWSLSPSMTPIQESSGWLAASERSWVSSVLPSNVSTYFAVRARDWAGFESNWTTPVHVVLDSVPPPVVPVNPIAAFTAFSGVSVGWSAVTDAESGISSYEVALLDANGTVRWSALEGPNATSYYVSVPPALWDTQLRVHVFAIDGAGNRGPPGAGVALYVDTMPPEPVVLDPLPEFTAGISLPLQWTGGLDAGSSTHRFEVEWSIDPLFASVLGADATSDNSLVVPGVPDGVELHFRVRAVDRVDHASPWANVSTTLDAGPPSAPTLNPIPAWMGPNGQRLNVSWLASSDAVSGVSHYLVWLEPDRFGTEQMVTGLQASFVLPDTELDSVCAVAEDMVGQRSAADCTAFSYDITPPSVQPAFGVTVFVGERLGTVHVWGTGTDLESGVSRVEVAVEEGPWVPAEGTAEWSANLTFPLPSMCSGLLALPGNFSVRGIDNVGNFYAVGFTMGFLAYLCPSAIAILEPPEEDEQSHEVLFELSAPSGQGDAFVFALIEGVWVELCNAPEPAFPGDEQLLVTCDISRLPDGPVPVKVRMASGNESLPRTVIARQVSLSLDVGTLQPATGAFRVGSSATIAVSVVNSGLGRSGTLTLRFYFVAGSNESLVAQTNLTPLNAHERSTVVVINLSLVQRGTFTLKVTASTSGAEQAPSPVTTTPFTIMDAAGTGPGHPGGLFLAIVVVGVAAAAGAAFMIKRRKRQPGP